MYRTIVVPLDPTGEADAAIAVALTTHGRGLSRLASGSVAPEVARHATVPLLAVRPSNA